MYLLLGVVQSLQNKIFWKGLYTHDSLSLPNKAPCIRNNRKHPTKSSELSNLTDGHPAKQVKQALGPQAMQGLSAEGATFRGVNRGTPSWLRAQMTSPPFSPHLFGDHPHFSPCAGATGKRVLTARILGVGGTGSAGTRPASGL